MQQRTRTRFLLFLVGVSILGAAWFGYRWYRSRQPDFLLAQGRTAILHEDWGQVDVIASRLEQRGYSNHALLLKGESNYRRQRYVVAFELLSQVSDNGPLEEEAALFVGFCFFRLGRLGAAEATLRQVVERRPDEVDAFRILAVIAYDMGRNRDAVVALKRVAELAPNDGRPHRQMGLIYKDTNQFEEAIDAYREALTRDLSEQVTIEVRGELAACLIKKYKFQEALDEIEPLPDEVKRLPYVAVPWAEALHGLQRTNEAREVLDSALAKHPESVELLLTRGKIERASGHAREALNYLQKAYELAPNDYWVHYELTQAYSATNQPELAAKHEQRVKDLQKTLNQLTELAQEAEAKPWDPEVRLQLAEAYEKLGKSKLAENWRQAAEACVAEQAP